MFAIQAPFVQVQFPDEDNLVSDWLPVAMPFSMGARAFWLPRIGSQVAVLMDEHGEDGIVLGSVYSQADPAPSTNASIFMVEMEDGTVFSMDPLASSFTLSTPGSGTVQTGGNLTTTVEGNLGATVGGALSATVSGNASITAAQITLKAAKITLDAPIVTATAILQAEGALEADGGITTSTGGAVPGNFNLQGNGTMGGQMNSATATIGGKSFAGHVHSNGNGGGNTGVPV